MENLRMPGDAIRNIAFMQDNCDEQIDDYVYQKILSEEEIEAERETFANIAIELQQIEETAKMIAEEYREKIKKKKELYNKSLTLIRVGRMEVTGTVYLIKDME